MATKKPSFGGYRISFAKVKEIPVSKIFGTGKITPSDMTKMVWNFIKKNKLNE